MAIEFAYSMNRAEYTKALRIYMSRFRPKAKRAVIILPLFFLYSVYEVLMGKGAFYTLCLLASGIALASLIYTEVLLPNKRYKAITWPITAKFADSGLSFGGDAIPWEAYTEICEAKGYIFFIEYQMQLSIVPKSALPEGALETIKNRAPEGIWKEQGA